MFVLGGIISILCAVWFYRTAEAKAAPAIQWAVVGFISYFLTNLAWTVWVARPLAEKIGKSAATKATLVSHSGIVIGAIVAWLIWSYILNKLKPQK